MSEYVEFIPQSSSRDDFIAGTFGGMAGVIAGHPLDTIKVRLQAANSKYRGIWDCLSTTIRKERLFGLYKGMASPLLGIAFLNSLVFGVYASFLGHASGFSEQPHLGMVYLAGFFSGFINSIFACPMEVVKIRLQNQGPKLAIYKGPLDCILQIISKNGIRGLFPGFWMTALRDAPSYGVYFMSFEFLSRSIANQHDESLGEPTLRLLAAGGTAGVLGWISTYPADVAKTRIQSVENFQNPDYKGVFRSFATIYKNGGSKVFFTGLGATLLRAFPTNACTFYTVITVKKYLQE